MSNIYYLGYSKPTTGGDFVNIEHVLELQKNGFNAFLLVDHFYDSSIFPNGTKSLSETTLNNDDWLVIPENNIDILNNIGNKNVVIHNQNTYYYLSSLQKLKNKKNIANKMICPSVNNALSAMKSGYNGSIAVIEPFIPEFFKPYNKKLQIAYSPRKLPIQANAVIGAFKQIFPEYDNIDWVEINGVERNEVAKILGESAIYAAFSNLEAISLSILEAMKCGCIIVGDHGGAGFDYSTNENGYWVDAKETVKYANLIAHAVDVFLNNNEEYISLVRKSIHTARKYDHKSFSSSLVDFWSCLI